MDSPTDEAPTPPPLSTTPHGFQIKGAATRKRKHSNADIECCTICLEAITERAIAVPCNHLTFDFLCLVQWLTEHSSCPLCKAEVHEVQYDWRGPDDCKTYHVANAQAQEAAETAMRGGARVRRDGTARRRGHGIAGEECPTSIAEDPGLTARRQVYDNRTPALHVGANRFSRYHDFTPEEFSASAELQSQARAFLRRELRVFGFLDRERAQSRRRNGREYLVEYVITVLKTKDAKAADGHAEELVADFLGRDDARLLLHETVAWLRSPYTDLRVWDGCVQYAAPAGRGQSVKHDDSRPAG